MCFNRSEKQEKNIFHLLGVTYSYNRILLQYLQLQIRLALIHYIKIYYQGKMDHPNGIPTIQQLLSQGIKLNQARDILLQYRPLPSYYPKGGAYQLVQTLLADRSCFDESYHWVRFFEAGLIHLPRRETVVEQLEQVLQQMIRYKQDSNLRSRDFACCMVFVYYRCWGVGRGRNWAHMYEQMARCLEHAFQILKGDHKWFKKNLSHFQSQDGKFTNTQREK